MLRMREILYNFQRTAQSAFRRSPNFRRDPNIWDFLRKLRKKVIKVEKNHDPKRI